MPPARGLPRHHCDPKEKVHNTPVPAALTQQPAPPRESESKRIHNPPGLMDSRFIYYRHSKGLHSASAGAIPLLLNIWSILLFIKILYSQIIFFFLISPPFFTITYICKINMDRFFFILSFSRRDDAQNGTEK